MPDGSDWLFQPLMRGLVKYESYLDGTLSLLHIARLNDALAVMDENAARLRGG